MPEYTENYGLTLPLKTENYDLDHMTDSMKIIDTELKRVDDKAQEVEQDLTQHKLDYATQMDLKIKNMTVNGDFRDGITGWSALDGVLSASNNTLTLTHDVGNLSRAYQSVSLPPSSYYLRCKTRILYDGASMLSLTIFDSATKNIHNINSPQKDKWYTLTGIVAEPATITRFPQIIQYVGTGGVGSVMEIREVISVDLTATFGAGNEPTKEEMDTLIDFLGGWFDGEITPSQKTLANWYLKMIRQNRNAIIAMGGTII